MNDTSSLPHGDANLGLFDASPDPRHRDPGPASGASTPLLGSAPFGVTRGDAVDLLRGLPSSSVDLIVTDPAYESLEKHRAIGTTTRLKHSKSSSNDWFAIFPNARFPELFAEAYRVLKRNTHLYLFCDQETMFVAKPEAERAGFKFWKPIVWDKCAIGMGYHYRSRYEMILFLEKGKRKLNDLGVPDVLRFPRVHRGYPSEKPPEVSEVLIRQSTVAGELIVDPFCGSGSVGVAALRQGRRFLGGDVSATAVGVATTRLAEVLAAPAAPGSAPAPAEAPRDEGPCS
jgi:site-specific DNA-methyltransferase (adenine-specific)